MERVEDEKFKITHCGRKIRKVINFKFRNEIRFYQDCRVSLNNVQAISRVIGLLFLIQERRTDAKPATLSCSETLFVPLSNLLLLLKEIYYPGIL